MNLIEFPEQTIVIAKDQPEYKPLPAYQFKDVDGRIVCCWRLSWAERLKLLLTGRIWHSILTFDQPLQPQLLQIEKPEMPKHKPLPCLDCAGTKFYTMAGVEVPCPTCNGRGIANEQ